MEDTNEKDNHIEDSADKNEFDKEQNDNDNLKKEEEIKNENVTDSNTNENSENEEESIDNKDSLEEKIKEAEDKYKRLLAEFENFRKRTEKEKIAMLDIGVESVLVKMLPIVDNFERAVSSITDDMRGNQFVIGVDNIYKQLLKVLEELKVIKIEALDKPFDEKLHNAVMMDETSDKESGIITEELQKGYMYKDNVLRHSMVKVKK